MTVISKNKSKRGSKRLSTVLSHVLHPTFEKRGHVQSQIMTHWCDIVGSEIAQYAVPSRLTFHKEGGRQEASLYLSVYGSRALEVEFLEPFILEKIRVFLGYNVITKIKLIQKLDHTGLSAKSNKQKNIANKRNSRKISEEMSGKKINTLLDDISDPELRSALEKLCDTSGGK